MSTSEIPKTCDDGISPGGVVCVVCVLKELQLLPNYYLMLYPGNNPQFIIALPLAACLLEGLLEIVWKNLGNDHS